MGAWPGQAWLRPASAGKEKWIPEKWASDSLSPVRAIFYFPGERKWIHMLIYTYAHVYDGDADAYSMGPERAMHVFEMLRRFEAEARGRCFVQRRRRQFDGGVDGGSTREAL